MASFALRAIVPALLVVAAGCGTRASGTSTTPPAGGGSDGGETTVGPATGDGGADGGATPADAGARDAGGPGPVSGTEYAPYFYTWGWGSTSYAFSTLVEMKSKGGPAAVTIAFVLSGGGCQVTTDIQDNLADVKAYVAAGGHVKASFGGADGTYLENACADAPSLAAAISAFVDATGITDLDFDIEQGSTSSNATLNAMRATALATVQAQKGIRVAFTLPVNPDGLDSLGLAVVTAAVKAGVAISFVNIMTMDYGDGTNLGSVPVQSIDATAKQLEAAISGLDADAAYRMLGVTPMIGDNDDSEVFSVANAQTLIAYAKEKHLGLVAFWAIQRDEKCPSGTDLDVCNGVSASTFQFDQIFGGVNN